ncbi:MAG: hypothetical protein ACI35R_02405 [Bacillus sp. (in: firmicutes)]
MTKHGEYILYEKDDEANSLPTIESLQAQAAEFTAKVKQTNCPHRLS